MEPAARKKVEIHNGVSPGDQGFTNPTSRVLWHFIYSTWVSIVLHAQTANSSVGKKCLQLEKYNETLLSESLPFTQKQSRSFICLLVLL